MCKLDIFRARVWLYLHNEQICLFICMNCWIHVYCLILCFFCVLGSEQVWTSERCSYCATSLVSPISNCSKWLFIILALRYDRESFLLICQFRLWFTITIITITKFHSSANCSQRNHAVLYACRNRWVFSLDRNCWRLMCGERRHLEGRGVGRVEVRSRQQEPR